MTTEEFFKSVFPPHPNGLAGAYFSVVEHLAETRKEWEEECEKRDLIRTISHN